jgi:hypothetical protein
MGQGGFPGQAEVSEAFPAHGSPFPDLGGLLHSRERVRVPFPHVVEQDEKLPHWPQLPLTS